MIKTGFKKLLLLWFCPLVLFIPKVIDKLFAINPDGTSYFDIATLYSHGQFKEAINAYWSPLYSWLLLLPDLFFRNLLFSSRFLNVTLLLVLVNLVYLLSRRINLSKEMAFTVTLLFFCTFLLEAICLITPDLLLSVIVTSTFLVGLEYLKNPKQIRLFQLGLIWGVGYLAKTAALPLAGIFLISLLVIPAVSSKKAPMRKLISGTILFLFGLAIIVLPWMGCIYSKYKKITYGTAGKYSYHEGVLLPAGMENQWMVRGVHKPIPGYTHAWGDPSYYVFGLKTEFNLKKELVAIQKNLRRLAIFFLFHLFLLTGLIIYLVRICCRKSGLDGETKFAFTFVILFGLSYVLIELSRRYLWPFLAVAYAFSGRIISEAISRRPIEKRLPFSGKLVEVKSLICLFLIVALAFSYLGLYLPVWQKAYQKIKTQYAADEDYLVYRVGQAIRRDFPEKEVRVFSNEFYRGLSACYFGGAKFFGAPDFRNPEGIREEADKYRINSILLWYAIPDFTPLLAGKGGFLVTERFNFRFGDVYLLRRSAERNLNR